MGIRVHQVAVAFDQFLNTLVAGWADETLSARAFRCGHLPTHKKRWQRAYKAINMLFFWQDDHCLEAFLSEQARTHLPVEYRP